MTVKRGTVCDKLTMGVAEHQVKGEETTCTPWMVVFSVFSISMAEHEGFQVEFRAWK